jgi:hypothetical protein
MVFLFFGMGPPDDSTVGMPPTEAGTHWAGEAGIGDQ